MHMQHHNTSPTVPAQNTLRFSIFLKVHHADISLTHGVLIPVYQKRVYYAGIKMFNKLPIGIESTYSNFKMFKVVLRHFLATKSTVFNEVSYMMSLGTIAQFNINFH
jgi:hypothetical protein